MKRLFIALLVALFAAPALADWPTSRGNPERTGNIDNQPGPADPGVVWVHRAHEHFIAAPSVLNRELYVSALGAFNTGEFYALSMDDAPRQRIAWSKKPPFLKLPTVSSPSSVGDKLFFGDGMHQTDGAVLHCVAAGTGLPIWNFEVPGKLVHIEGTPTVFGRRAFVGAGNAGVICVDFTKVVVNNADVDIAVVQGQIEDTWKVLKEKYEDQKKKDPDLAIPPSEDALPKFVPHLLWQAGKDKWHVDAPTVWAANKLIVASAFLDDEKSGDRAVIALNYREGTVAWETPLDLNPWAGPTVAGDLVLVGCSNIRFDLKDVPRGKGQVVALGLEKGDVRWKKDYPGGVLSCVAAAEGLAVFTSTDGKVRAVELANGHDKWTYDAGAPIFAGVAIAGGGASGYVAYAADLHGVIHAINLADGSKKWTLDLAKDPEVKTGGEVYGSPIVHNGRLYLATCAVDMDRADAPTSVICIGEKSAVVERAAMQTLTIDKEHRRVVVPARIAPRKLPELKDIYPLEVIATFPSPLGQKAHETVVTYDVKPSDIHKALESLGLKAGSTAKGEDTPPTGPLVKISLELIGLDGKPRLIPIERSMVDIRTGKSVPPLKWYFTGSVMKQPDPNKPEKVYAADMTGTLITIFPVTDETVFQSDLSMKDEPYLKLETRKSLLPDEDAAVKIVIEPAE